MTLQHLKYAVKISELGSMTLATQELYVTQPGLTKTVKELEKEMGISIFERTAKGIRVTRDGELFLGYARQVLEQAELLEFQYKNPGQQKKLSRFPPSIIPLRTS